MSIPSILQRLRIYTDQNEIYEKLTEDNKTFNLKRELFLAALVIGVVNNKKSEKRPRKTNILDFIKLPRETQELIYLLSEVAGRTGDLEASCDDILRYADGGLELIWEAYRDQGTLDVTRLVEEAKEKWSKRLEELKIAKQKTELEKIIGERESGNIEYKASMLWDYKAKRENKKLLGGIIARAIASFMNVDGGLLLIGVGDNKQILGLKKDLNVLNKHTLDQFEQHFTNIIENYLGVENTLNANIQFKTAQGKTIAVVEVPKKAPKPVYYKSEKEEIFFIRANNTSRRLPNSQVPDYIKQHWPELYK